jgi:hypothetical protein
MERGTDASLLAEALLGCQGRGLDEVVSPDFCTISPWSPSVSMALTMREDAWATWKPKTPESNKSVQGNPFHCAVLWHTQGTPYR